MGKGATPSFLMRSPVAKLVKEYCRDCHQPENRKGKIDLESLLTSELSTHSETWSKVAAMLREREMPPPDEPNLARPTEADYLSSLDWLETALHLSASEGNLLDHIDTIPALVGEYCLQCHNQEDRKGSLDLETIQSEEIVRHPEIWEKVVRRLASRQMPPPNRARPSEALYDQVLAGLTAALDRRALHQPRPGRGETFRRLNRTEYQNAIRDLVGISFDASTLLPKDEESFGFDNVTVGTLSPSLLDRYVTAAQRISRLAVGLKREKLQGDTFRLPADYTQEKHIPGLPLGTRGGILINYTFPQDGTYEIVARLTRDRNEHVEGLGGVHEMDILVDRKLIRRFKVTREKGQRHSEVDQHLKVRVPVKAGPKTVGVTFVQKSVALLENKRQPFEASFNLHRHPRRSPAIYQVSINGPYDPQGAQATPSRSKIFIAFPQTKAEEEPVAQEILRHLMTRAFRRAVHAEDLEGPMGFYRKAAAQSGFEAGIEHALTSILVSPEFLFRIERDPANGESGQAYSISDLELANRLSFFLWSSLPDERLLDDAIAGELGDPGIFEGHVERLLKDERAANLITNFANQWLHLRNLNSITPDLRLFPDFDDNLRQAFREETERFLLSILREDQSVLNMLQSNYTYLNERLAHHYDIPGVYGSRFRRVELSPESHRGGLLRQGSILTVTSYATRTSPVIRGNWILDNLIGTPPPPPPPDVPTLEDNRVDANLSMRDRLAAHRDNPACASCHNLMDPIGFSLENFDAVGRWREFENGASIDVAGGLPDGNVFAGIDALEAGLLERPELFVHTLTEKLMTFALGRGLDYNDAPAIRRIVADAKESEFRFSSIILGITTSVPFQMRSAANNAEAMNVDPLSEHEL